jgi:microcystin-dependent protein
MDIGASNWNETDANNSNPSPDGAPEGMAPSGVDDTIRAVMGAVKRFFNWQSTKLTGGTSTAYTLSYGIAPGALVDGMTHLVQFHVANGAGATLNVNNLGAKPLHAYSAGAWYQAPPAFFDIATVCRVVYDAGAGVYRLLMPGSTPTGMVTPFAGSSAPAGYALCYGQAVSRANYPGLFAVIGATYGAGDGSTTFNLPDLRGLVAAGMDNMGGTNANRLSSQLPSTTLGATGGTQAEAAAISGTASGTIPALSVSVISTSMDGPSSNFTAASGTNNVGDGGHTHANVRSTGSTGPSGISLGVSGSTAVVTNVQPTMILNHIIKL